MSDIPPGLEVTSECTEVQRGGDIYDWMPFERRKLYTNAFIVQNGKLLLGYKKRGFGKHKYNGFGGKVEPGETAAEAALRELQEEAGIEAPLKHIGVFLFLSEGAEWAFQIEIYRAEEYTGIISETEEMRPQWFTIPPHDVSDASIATTPDPPYIPSDQMWEGDSFWLPLLIANRPFVGRADFRKGDEDTFTLQKWWFGVTA